MIDMEEFTEFLDAGGKRKRSYQPRTKAEMLACAALAWRRHAAGEPPSKWSQLPMMRSAAERLLAWNESTGEGEEWLTPEFAMACRTFIAGFKRAQRRTPPRSIDDTAWGKLWAILRAQTSVEAVVLRLMAATGLRISDAIGVERIRVLEGFAGTEQLIDLTVKGGKPRVRSIAGAPDEWNAVHELFKSVPLAKNIAELVVRGDGRPPDARHPAYSRVRHELQRLGTQASVSGRIHLHRIRRTVAVKALAAGADLMLVKELLDQESVQTTIGYLDEARTEQVADMQRKLLDKFRPPGTP